jgi:hypothetical protein
MRFVWRQQTFDALIEFGPRSFGLHTCFAGEEVDRTYRVVLTLQLSLQAREFRGCQRRQPAVRVLPRFAQLGVVLGAVEQLSIGLALVGRARLHGHQPGAAALTRAFVGEVLQRLLAIDLSGQ